MQANGFPAMAAYGGLNGNMCLYLDNRSEREAMATPPEMQARAAWDGPLRIVHAGRLIAMKGTQDLIPIALALRGRLAGFPCRRSRRCRFFPGLKHGGFTFSG